MGFDGSISNDRMETVMAEVSWEDSAEVLVGKWRVEGWNTWN